MAAPSPYRPNEQPVAGAMPPYAPPSDWASTPVAPGYPAGHQTIRITDAGFALRLGAWLVDAGLTFGALVLLEALFDADGAFASLNTRSGFNASVGWLGIAVWIVTKAALESSGRSTPGKAFVGIRVVTGTPEQQAGGNPPSFGTALWRNLASGLSLLVLGVGYLMVPFTYRHQAMHDMLATTFVVRR